MQETIKNGEIDLTMETMVKYRVKVNGCDKIFNCCEEGSKLTNCEDCIRINYTDMKQLVLEAEPKNIYREQCMHLTSELGFECGEAREGVCEECLTKFQKAIKYDMLDMLKKVQKERQEGAKNAEITD